MSRYDAEYAINAALGKVSGVAMLDKFGSNSDVDAAEDVWEGGGIYTGFPTGAAEKMEVLSSDAADDAGSTGAITVEISNLLDADGVLLDPVNVTLNGTTAVALDATQTYSRASRIRVLTAGSTGSNEGVITLRHITTTTNIFATVPIGDNQSSVCCYTVPFNHSLLINKLYATANISGGGNNSASMGFYSRPNGGVFNKSLHIEVSAHKDFNSIAEKYFYTVPAMTDIKIRVDSVSTANTIVTGGFGGELIDLSKV